MLRAKLFHQLGTGTRHGKNCEIENSILGYFFLQIIFCAFIKFAHTMHYSTVKLRQPVGNSLVINVVVCNPS